MCVSTALDIKTKLRAESIASVFSVFLTANWNPMKFSCDLSVVLRLFVTEFVKQST